MYRVDDKWVVSPTDLVAHLNCPHHTALSMQRALGRPVSCLVDDHVEGDVQVLQRRGDEHERAHLDSLRSDGRSVVEIKVDDGSLDALLAAEARTVAAMAQGVEVIFQATFLHDTGRGVLWRGHADFLHRIGEVPGSNGLWCYEPEDTKLARHVKPATLVQLASYAKHIERLQGSPPRQIHVQLGDNTRWSIQLRRVAAYFRAAKAQFERRLALGPESTYPLPVPHCAVCRYQQNCEDQWKADDHLTLVAALSKEQAVKFSAVGVKTVAALGADQSPPEITGIGRATVVRLRQQARLQVQARNNPSMPPPYERLPEESGRGLLTLPVSSNGDLYFDIEGDPFVGLGGLEYLLGVGGTGDGELGDEFGFRAYWAHTEQAEKESFEQFIDFVVEQRQQYPDMHVYHYAAYEKTALGKLSGRHHTREAEVDSLFRDDVLVDLYRIVRQSMAIGTPSYSIKKLEALYMGARDGTITDAASSIVQYEKWIDTHDQAILDEIEKYNHDDCWSTYGLHRWLQQFGVFASADDPTEHSAPPAPDESALSELYERLGGSTI